MPGTDATEEVKSFLTRVEAERRMRGWRRIDLAREAHVCESTLWSIEKIGHDPLYDTKRKIARAYGLKVSDLWPNETDD